MSEGPEPLTLVWFRDDLRVDDHEALTAACADGQVIGIWIRERRDDNGLGPRPLGGAARWWAHESLRVLEAELAQLGIPLLFAAGSAADIIPQRRRGAWKSIPSAGHAAMRPPPAASTRRSKRSSTKPGARRTPIPVRCSSNRGLSVRREATSTRSSPHSSPPCAIARSETFSHRLHSRSLCPRLG